jgi:hypothetical protein
VWAKTWSQIIDAAKARMAFFQKQFAYEATTDSALELLRRLHAERLPMILREGAPDNEDADNSTSNDTAEPMTAGRPVRRVPASAGAESTNYTADSGIAV